MSYTKRFYFGEFVPDQAPMTVEDVDKLCDLSEVARDELQSYPFDKVQRVMKALSRKWSDPNYSWRKIAEKELPKESGYASEMIQKGLDVMAGLLDPDFLQKKLKTELRDIPVIEGYEYNFDNNTARQWQPLGVVLHVLAGNVFTGGVGSWIEGALTRNVTILKMSSSERIFMPLFIASLKDCDPDGVLTRSTALIEYSSSQTDVMARLKNRMDGVVVWGGEQAVRAYREDLPARTRFVVFGPKLSLSIVTKSGLVDFNHERLAKSLAQEMAVWDQNACTAPQVCYVEGKENAYKLAEFLADSLKEVEKDIPSGDIDLHAAVEIRKLRSLYEVNHLVGKSGFWSSGEDLRWSVFVDEDDDLQPSPLHRTIRIIPYDRVEQVVDQIKSFRGYVQTVALECAPSDRLALTSQLTKFGVIRVVSLGQMAGGEIDDPHDGAYDLPQLLNMVIVRSTNPKEQGIDPIDRLNQMDRNELLNSYFRKLIDRARDSEYYGKLISAGEEELGRSFDKIDDLQSLPVLKRSSMEGNMPPTGSGLAVKGAAYSGGYVSRSGGSTGKPKFSIYDDHDWSQMISRAKRIMLAAGLRPGDRLANCMISGDMYGSFVSFDHIVAKMNITSFAFSTKVSAEMFVDVCKGFGINAIQGVPAFVVPLLREAKAIHPELKMEKFLFAGQALSESDREWLESELDMSCISSIIGANDGGQIAFQCEHLSGSKHHVTDDFNYIEIVDNNGKRVASGQPGNILITSLQKYAFPLIRYEIGDSARFLDEECACGRTNRIMEYLGRTDNMFSVGFLNLDFNDIEQALKPFKPTVVQVIARLDEGGRDYIVLRFETDFPDKVSHAEVLKALKMKIPVLEDRIAEKRLAKVEIETYEIGSLPRDARSSKVKQFLDER